MLDSDERERDSALDRARPFELVDHVIKNFVSTSWKSVLELGNL